MKIRETAGGVVISKSGKIAIVSQQGNSWSLPKGGIDENEDVRTAALREIREETGLYDLVYIKKIGTYNRHRIALHNKPEDKTEIKRITMFLYITNQTILSPEDPENPEARWVNIDEVTNYLTHQKDREFFLSIMPTLKRYIQKL